MDYGDEFISAAAGGAASAVTSSMDGLERSSLRSTQLGDLIDALAGGVGSSERYQDAWDENTRARQVNIELMNELIKSAAELNKITAARKNMENVQTSNTSRSIDADTSINPFACDPAILRRMKIPVDKWRKCAAIIRTASGGHSVIFASGQAIIDQQLSGHRRSIMKRFSAASALLLMTSVAWADVPVIDSANLEIARRNAENTGEIMKTNEDILAKSEEILKALSGSRDGSMGIASEGLAGGMSVSSAPSFSSIMEGGTMSFGGLGSQAQSIAGKLINGLQLVKQLVDVVEGKDPGAMNNAYSSSVNVATLLSALTQQASQGAAAREQALQSASGQIGSAEDVKGSVDANTRMQLETARTINELISVSNGTVAAANQELQMQLTKQSKTKKMMQYRDVNPFKK